MAIFLHSLQPAILQSCCTAILRREESREGVECAGEIGLVTYLSLSLSLWTRELSRQTKTGFYSLVGPGGPLGSHHSSDHLLF